MGDGSEWGAVGPPHEGSMAKTGDDNTCMARPKFNSCQAMQCFKLHVSDKCLPRNKRVLDSPSLSCCSAPC